MMNDILMWDVLGWKWVLDWDEIGMGCYGLGCGLGWDVDQDGMWIRMGCGLRWVVMGWDVDQDGMWITMGFGLGWDWEGFGRDGDDNFKQFFQAWITMTELGELKYSPALITIAWAKLLGTHTR